MSLRIIFAVLLILSFCSCENKTGDLKAGDEAPEFELVDLNGEKLSLDSFSGKAILLNFWATWCVPCLLEMPSMEELYQKYKKQGLEVVAINVDSAKNKDKVRKFIEEKNLNFVILLDPEISTPPQYGLTGFPESFLIGPNKMLYSAKDPYYERITLRFDGERPWSSEPYYDLIDKFLEKIKSNDPNFN